MEAGGSVAALIADSNNLSTLRGIDRYASLIQVHSVLVLCTYLGRVPLRLVRADGRHIRWFQLNGTAPFIGHLVISKDVLITVMISIDCHICVKIPHLLQGDLILSLVPRPHPVHARGEGI